MCYTTTSPDLLFIQYVPFTTHRWARLHSSLRVRRTMVKSWIVYSQQRQRLTFKGRWGKCNINHHTVLLWLECWNTTCRAVASTKVVVKHHCVVYTPMWDMHGTWSNHLFPIVLAIIQNYSLGTTVM